MKILSLSVSLRNAASFVVGWSIILLPSLWSALVFLLRLFGTGIRLPNLLIDILFFFFIILVIVFIFTVCLIVIRTERNFWNSLLNLCLDFYSSLGLFPFLDLFLFCYRFAFFFLLLYLCISYSFLLGLLLRKWWLLLFYFFSFRAWALLLLLNHCMLLNLSIIFTVRIIGLVIFIWSLTASIGLLNILQLSFLILGWLNSQVYFLKLHRFLITLCLIWS